MLVPVPPVYVLVRRLNNRRPTGSQCTELLAT